MQIHTAQWFSLTKKQDEERQLFVLFLLSFQSDSRLSGRRCLPMDNEKCIMDNEGVAFGDILEIIFEENATIVNYQLSIIHSCVSTINGNLSVLRRSVKLYCPSAV